MAIGDFFRNPFRKSDVDKWLEKCDHPTDEILKDGDKVMEEVDRALAESNRLIQEEKRLKERQIYLLQEIRNQWNQPGVIDALVTQQSLNRMLTQIDAQPNEASFVLQQMYYGRQHYLELNISSIMQNPNHIGIPISQHYVTWMLHHLGVQGDDEANFVVQQMQLRFAGQNLVNDRKNSLKSRVIEFHKERVEEYQKKARKYQCEVEQNQDEATYQQREIDLKKHEFQTRRNIESVRGLSLNTADLMNEMFMGNIDDARVRYLKDSAFDNQLKVSFYEGATKREREKMRHYEQIGVEIFTEGFVAHLLSEPLLEPSDL